MWTMFWHRSYAPLYSKYQILERYFDQLWRLAKTRIHVVYYCSKAERCMEIFGTETGTIVAFWFTFSYLPHILSLFRKC